MTASDTNGSTESDASDVRDVHDARYIVDHLPELAWSALADGTVDFYNRRYLEYAGVTADDLRGWGWQALHDPAALPEFVERWRESLATGAPFEMEHRLREAGGAYRWFLTRARPARDGAGRVVRWIGVSTDVDERRRLEEALTDARVQAEHARQLEASARRDAEAQRGILDLIVDQSGEGIIMADERGIIRVFNPAAQRQHGVAKGEVTASQWASAYGLLTLDGRPLPVEQAPIANAVNGIPAKDARWLVKRPDGQTRTIFGTATPLRHPDGAPAGGVLFTRDETERIRAEAHRARQGRHALLLGEVGSALVRSDSLGAVLQTCAEAVVRHLEAALARIWMIDAEANELVLHASSGIDARIDREHARVPIGDSKIGLIAQDDEPRLTNDLANDATVSDRDWVIRERMVAFAGYPLTFEGKVLGVVAMFARKPMAQDTLDAFGSVANAIALGIQRNRLEADQKAAIVERERLIKSLERSNGELDQFAYVASHDLKAPLRGIANLSQWIEEDLGDRISDETRENMSLMRGRVHRLEGLIDGILNYSRAGRVLSKAEVVDIRGLLADAVELLAPRPGVDVVIGSDMPTLLVERVPFQQVFMNLIGNALKYTRRPDARVVVDVRRDGPYHHFRVADNGPGIAPEYHERIWGIFQTLEARDDVEGTGIGLSVVKKIVETRGGRTWVESAPEQGATFHVLWPERSS